MGNSLAIRLPDEFAQAHGLKAGSHLELVVDKSDTRLRVKKRPRCILDELLASAPDDFDEGEWDIGPPVGYEVW